MLAAKFRSELRAEDRAKPAKNPLQKVGASNCHAAHTRQAHSTSNRLCLSFEQIAHRTGPQASAGMLLSSDGLAEMELWISSNVMAVRHVVPTWFRMVVSFHIPTEERQMSGEVNECRGSSCSAGSSVAH